MPASSSDDNTACGSSCHSHFCPSVDSITVGRKNSFHFHKTCKARSSVLSLCLLDNKYPLSLLLVCNVSLSCWSYYGKVGGGQIVSMMKGGCTWKGVIQHELDHALGFLHEHSRSDRDKHVKIMWDYISPRKYLWTLRCRKWCRYTLLFPALPSSMEGVDRKHVLSTMLYITDDRPDFKKFENSRNLGLPYDYASVMHYGP